MSKLSDQQKIDLVQEYTTQIVTATDLANKYGVSLTSISSILKNRGIKRRIPRKYPFNEQYFDVVDNEDKAYILGFLYADGCNYEKRGSIIVALQETDAEILNLIKEKIGLKKPLMLRDRSKDKDSNKRKNQLALEICSRHFSNSLVQLGCFQAKSLVLNFPTKEQVPSHLMSHFMRGYFDGDANFLKYEHKDRNCQNYKISFGSSNIFCKSFADFIKENFNIHTSIYHPKDKHELYDTVMISGRIQCKKVLDWVYKDATIYLKRKYDKYLEIFGEQNG